MSYSQNNEEEVILDHFGDRVGRFLDIGAFDGVTYSNTRALVARGWHGICVEPNPYSFLKLLKACEQKQVECVLAAVGCPEDAGIVPFYGKVDDSLDTHGVPSATVSTINDAHRDKWAMAVGGWTSFHVPVISPEVLLSHLGWHYDFVNIDVEGGNWQLLQQFPISAMDAELVCVEYEDRAVEMVEWLKDHGYEVIHRTTENLIARIRSSI